MVSIHPLYDTIVALSNDVKSDGTLPDVVKSIVGRSIVLYIAHYSKKITMSGRNRGTTPDRQPIQALAMKEYAVKQGMPLEDILTEEKSLDTVGQAYFVKRDILVPNNWSDLVVITGDYHVKRAKSIFNFILGKDFRIDYVGVSTSLNSVIENLKHEEQSLKAFFNTFRGVITGDDLGITERLFSAHPFYKDKNPSTY